MSSLYDYLPPGLFQIRRCKNLPPDGSVVSCLVEHREIAKDGKCRSFLHKMAAIVYSDYRLIKGFYQQCHQDVKKFNCGKLSTKNENVCFYQLQCIFAKVKTQFTKLPNQTTFQSHQPELGHIFAASLCI